MDENSGANAHFGIYLKSLRKSKKMTLTELAKEADVSHSFLSQVENGKKGIPSISVLFKLADALDIPRSILVMKAGYSVTNNAPRPAYPAEITQDDHPLTQELAKWGVSIGEDWFQVFLREKDIMNYLRGRPEITYKGQFLTIEERERVVKMLELLFPDK